MAPCRKIFSLNPTVQAFVERFESALRERALDRCASGDGCRRDGYDCLEGLCERHLRAAIDEAHAEFIEAYREWQRLGEMYEQALKARERGESWR